MDLAYFSDHETQLEALLAGRAEFAWLSPTAYVLARQRLAIVPLVKPVIHSRTTYRSLLLVREEDPARSLEDLRGKRVLFVRPDSTSGSIFPHSFLKQRGIDPEAYFASTGFSGSHYKSFFALAQKEADGIFVDDSLLSSASVEMKTHFRILETVAKIPHGPIVAHPNVLLEERQALRDAFQAYETDPLNRSLVVGLKKATGIQAFRGAKDGDYVDVRRHLRMRGGSP
jgi:phosphonate transport system substrate-binding protein